MVGMADDLKQWVKNGDSNDYEVIARDKVLIDVLNGHMMCEVIDDDTEHRKMSGLIGVLVYVGPPMKIGYRNMLLKQLP